MHTYAQRLNSIFFYALTVLLGLSLLASFSSTFDKGQQVVSLSEYEEAADEWVIKHQHAGSGGSIDRALIYFDLIADLSPAFDWNIKQLFVFVMAEYSTPTNPRNEVILWDKIVESPKEAQLHFPNTFIEYGLLDQGTGLRGKEISLHLHWDRMPLTGKIYMEDTATSKFTLPTEYQSRTPRGE